MIIGLLCFVTMQAQELSWDWWPTGFSDSCEQADTLHYTASIQGVASSGRYAPTWIQSLENGEVSASAYSGSVSAGIYKKADSPSVVRLRFRRRGRRQGTETGGVLTVGNDARVWHRVLQIVICACKTIYL